MTQKRAKVVEEVVVTKDVEEREQSVRDTVRRKDVDVDTIEADTRGPAAAGGVNKRR